MAKIVFAAGTSHSPALGSTIEDYLLHGCRDRERDWQLDINGNRCTFDDLINKTNRSFSNEIAPEIILKRIKNCKKAIEKMRKNIKAASLDALIIIGDDQKEQYLSDNMPSILIYGGEFLHNVPLRLGPEAPDYWRKARQQYHELKQPCDYPVHSDLAKRLTTELINANFDISYSCSMDQEIGEGHAFGFVHQRLIKDLDVPVVPVIINTYYPPNQPGPQRCYELGRSISAAIRKIDNIDRVGIIASGGLSHFTIDECLDRQIIEACKGNQPEFWAGIPKNKLKSGNSEIRNWITLAGTVEHLAYDWSLYEPCYRTEAGTGCGMAFAVWR